MQADATIFRLMRSVLAGNGVVIKRDGALCYTSAVSRLTTVVFSQYFLTVISRPLKTEQTMWWTSRWVGFEAVRRFPAYQMY